MAAYIWIRLETQFAVCQWKCSLPTSLCFNNHICKRDCHHHSFLTFFFPFIHFFCMRRLNRIAGNFRNHIWAFFCWWNNRKMPNYQQRSKCIRKDQKSPDLYWNGENIPWDTWQRNDSIQSMCHIKDINAAEWLTWQKREVSQWSVITSHCSVFIWISSINTTSTAVEHGYTREPILQLHVACSYHISTTIEHLSSITSMRCISHISIPSQRDHSFTSPHRGQLA